MREERGTHVNMCPRQRKACSHTSTGNLKVISDREAGPSECGSRAVLSKSTSVWRRSGACCVIRERSWSLREERRREDFGVASS